MKCTLKQTWSTPVYLFILQCIAGVPLSPEILALVLVNLPPAAPLSGSPACNDVGFKIASDLSEDITSDN